MLHLDLRLDPSAYRLSVPPTTQQTPGDELYSLEPQSPGLAVVSLCCGWRAEADSWLPVRGPSHHMG